MGRSTVLWRVDEGPSGPATDVPQRAGTGDDCEGDAGYRNLWCPRDDTRIQVRLKCAQPRQCPVCVRYWARAQGVKVAWRMKEFMRLKGFKLAARHVTVELPTREALSPEGYANLLREAWLILRKMGARGGIIVPHLWRRQDAWKGRPWPETPVEATWYAPHVHFVGVGRVDADKRPAGAFVKTIRKTEGDEDVARLSAYLLDHAATLPRKHCIRWVGLASYSKSPRLDPAPADWLAERWPCPLCGTLMVSLEIVDYTDMRDADRILYGRGQRG